MVAWNHVTRDYVLRAIEEYDGLGPEQFFYEHGFAPTTTYELVWKERRYPPKAILGTAYELAMGQRLGSSDFEGGKTGAVRVLGRLGFIVKEKRRPTKCALVALAHMAKLCSKLSFHCDCLDQSPLPHALCHRGDSSSTVVQFRASVFHVATSALYGLDGRERIGTAAGCILCGSFLPGEC